MGKKRITPEQANNNRFIKSINSNKSISDFSSPDEYFKDMGTLDYSGVKAPGSTLVGAESSQGQSFDEDGFNERLGKGLLPNENAEDLYAENQSGAEQIALMPIRTVSGTLLKTLQGFSILGSLIEETAVEVLDNITNRSMQKAGLADGTWDLEDVTNNPVNDLFFRMEDSMKEFLKIHKSSDWNDKSFIEQIASSAWWADEGADGLSFAFSNFVPAGALGKLGIGTKIMSRLAGGLELAEDVVTGAARLSSKKGLMGALTEGTRELQRAKSGILGIGSNPIKAAKNIDEVLQNAYMTSNEALFEAKDTGEQVKNKILENYKTENPQALVDTWEDLPDDIKAKNKNSIGEAMRNTFLMNAGALWFSNKIELGMANKLFGKVEDSTVKQFITGGTKAGEDYAMKSTKGIKNFFNTKVGALAKEVPKQMAVEGLWEENIQNAIQKVNVNYGVSGKQEYFLGKAAEALGVSVENLSDKDAWKSIGSGMLIGGLFGGGSSMYERGKAKTEAQKTVAELNKRTSNFINLKNNLYEKEAILDEEGKPTGEFKVKLDEEGKPVYDLKTLTNYAANSELNKDLAQLHDIHKNSGLGEIADILKNEVIKNYAYAHLEAGFAEDMYNKINFLSDYKDEDLASLGINPIETEKGERKQRAENLRNIKEKLTQIEEDFNNTSKTIDYDLEPARHFEAVSKISRFRELNRIKNNLEKKNVALAEKTITGNSAVDLINAYTKEYQSLVNNLPMAEMSSDKKRLDDYKKRIELISNEIKTLKDTHKDDIAKPGYLIPDNNTEIDTDFTALPEYKESKKIQDYLVQVQESITDELEDYKKITDYKDGSKNFETYVIEQKAKKEKVEDKPNEAINDISKYEDNDEIHYKDKDGNKKQGFISTENGVKKVNTFTKVDGKNVVENVSNLQDIVDNNQSRRISKKKLKTSAIRKLLEKAYNTKKEEYKLLRNRQAKATKFLTQKQFEKENLIEDAKSKKIRISKNQLYKQIQLIDSEIEATEDFLKDSEKFKIQLNIEMLSIADRIKEEEIDDSFITDKIKSLKNTLVDLDADIKEQQNLIVNLKNYKTYLTSLFNNLFPSQSKSKKVDKTQPDTGTEEEFSDIKRDVRINREQEKQVKETLKGLEEIREKTNKDLIKVETQLANLENQLNHFDIVDIKADFVETDDIEAKTGNDEDFFQRKPDVEKGVFKTGGNDNVINKQESQKRWFKYTETLIINSKLKDKLKVISVNDSIYGVGKEKDIFTEQDIKYKTDNDLRVLVVDAKGNPVIYEGGLVHTSLIQPISSLDETDMFKNDSNLSKEKLDIIFNEYKEFFDFAKTTKEDVFLTITGKSNGVKIASEDKAVNKALGKNWELQINKDKNSELEFASLDFGDSTLDKAKGTVYFKDERGRIIPAKQNKISLKTADALIIQLKDYLKTKNEKGNPNTFITLLSSVVYTQNSSTRTKLAKEERDFFFVKDQDLIKVGNSLLNYEDIISGKNDEVLKQFLINQYHQVKASLLDSNKSYTDVFGNKYSNYKEYLTKERSVIAEIPLVTDVAEFSSDINNRQFLNTYLRFKYENQNSTKNNKTKEDTKSSLDEDSDEDGFSAIDDKLFGDVPSVEDEFKVKETEPVKGNVATFDSMFTDEESAESIEIVSSKDRQKADEKNSNLPNIEDEIEEANPFDLKASRVSREYQKADNTKEFKWFKGRFPNLPIEEVIGLIENKSFGRFLASGKILISNMAVEGTVYHEAFHAVSRLYLTVAERKSLYENYYSSLSQLEKESLQNKSKENGNSLAYEIEEDLAEKFREFGLAKQKPKSLIEKIFQKLWDFIKSVVGLSKSEVEELFERIEAGDFSNAIVVGKDVKNADSVFKDYTEDFKQNLNNSITYLLFNNLFKNGFNSQDLLNFSAGVISDENKNHISEIYNSILNQIKGGWFSYSKLPEEEAKNISSKYWNFVRDNWRQITKEHVESLNSFGIRFSLEDEIENSEEESRSKDTLGIMNSTEISPKDTMTNAVKLLIRSLPLMDKNGIKINYLGLPTISNYSKNIAVLQNELAGLSTIEQQVEKIKSLTEKTPEFSILLRNLKVIGEDITALNLTESDITLQRQFRQQFHKHKSDFVITSIDDEGNIFNFDANTDKLTTLIKTDWANKLRSFKIEKNPLLVEEDGLIKLNYNNIALIHNDFIKPKEKITDDIWLLRAKYLGFHFSNEVDVNVANIKNPLKAIYAYLAKNKIIDADLFNEKLEVKGFINKIVLEEVKTTVDFVDNQHITAEGKTCYSISLNDYNALIVQKLNNGTANHLTWNEETKQGNPAVRFSRWLGSKINLKILEGLTEKDSSGGKVTSKLTTGDALLQHIQAIFGSESIDPIFPLFRAGDKILEKGYSIEGFELRTKEEAIEEFKKDLSSEILTSWFLVNEEEGSTVRFFKDKARGLRIFKDAFQDEAGKKVLAEMSNLIKEKDLDTFIKKIDEFVQTEAVHLQLYKWVDAKVAKTTKLLLDNKLIKKVGINYKRQGLPTTEFQENINEAQLKYLVEKLTVNDLIGKIEQTKLFTGDLAFYNLDQSKNKLDFFKRVGGLLGTGKTSDTSPSYLKWLNTNVKRRDNKKFDGIIKTLVYDDVKVASSYRESYINFLKEIGFDEQFVVDRLDTYDSMDEADAQGYKTLDEYKTFLHSVGDWTPQHEAAYQKAYTNEKLTKEDMFYFQPLKPQYFGPQSHNGRLFIPTFYKLSIMPLIPSLTKGTQLDDMRLMMENKENQIGMALFLTANKVGNSQSNTFYNENGTINVNDVKTQNIFYDYLKIQLDIAPKIKTKVPFGTQFRKLILANLSEMNLTINGVLTSGKDIIKQYNGLINDMVNVNTKSFMKKLGVEQVGDSFKITNLDYLKKMLVNESIKRSLPDNIVLGLQKVFDSKTKVMEILVSSDKIESILMSLINNNIVKSQVFGDMKILGASTGFESKARKQSEVTEKWASNLDTLKNYDPKDRYMEVYLPQHFKELIGKDLKISDIQDKRLLELIGFRIPTQALNSIEVIKVKGFLPEEAGNLIIVPSEMVGKAGADYDVDKLTIFFPNYKVNYNWNKLSVGFLKENFKTEKGIKLENRDYIKDVIDRGDEDILSLEEDDLRIYNSFKEFVKNSKYNLIDVEYIEYVEGSQNPKAIQNKIIELARNIASAPENFLNLIQPNTSKDIELLSDELKALNNEGKKPIDINNLVDLDYNYKVREEYLIGSGGIGIMSLQSVHHVMTQIANIFVKDSSFKIHLDHNQTENGNIDLSKVYPVTSYNKDGSVNKNSLSILDIISQFQNGFLDIANNPFLININATTETANIYAYLIRAGVDVRQAVMFMNQPIIKRYLDLKKENSSTFLKIQGLELKGYEIKKQVFDEFSVKEGEEFNLFNDNSLSIYKAQITADRLKEQITNPDNALQSQLFIDFLNYETQSLKLKDLIEVSNQDTKGASSDLTRTELSIDRYNEVIAEDYFENTEALFKDTFIGAFKEAVHNSVEYYKDLFLTQRPEIREVINDMKDNLIVTGEDLAKAINVIKNDTINYILQNGKVDGRKIGARLEELFLGKNSLAHKIAKLKQSGALKNNLIIRELYPLISESTTNAKPNIKDFNNIKLFNKKITSEDSNSLTKAWQEIFNVDDSLGKDLIYFSILQSGINNSPISFLKLAPNDVYLSIVDNIIDNYIDKPDLTQIKERILENNVSNESLTPRIPKKFLKNSNLEVPFFFSRDKETKIKVALSVARWNKDNKTWERWELVDTDSKVDIYKKADKKGNGMFFKEFTTQTSIARDNTTREKVTTVYKPTILENVKESKAQPKGVEVQEGVFINQNAITEQEQLQLFEFLKPVLEEQAIKSNSGKYAPKMAGLNLNWDYVNGNTKRRDILNQTRVNVGKSLQDNTAYGWFNKSANNLSLYKMSKEFKNLITKASGIDISNYDGAIVNIYKDSFFIGNHPDIDESITALQYPVVVVNIGGKGNIIINNKKYTLNAGSSYSFGLNGKNRTAPHSTDSSQNNGFLPLLTTKIDGETIPANSYRITITLRRVMPLEKNMPIKPKLINATITEKEVETLYNKYKNRIAISTGTELTFEDFKEAAQDKTKEELIAYIEKCY